MRPVIQNEQKIQTETDGAPDLPGRFVVNGVGKEGRNGIQTCDC